MSPMVEAPYMRKIISGRCTYCWRAQQSEEYLSSNEALEEPHDLCFGTSFFHTLL